MFLRKHMTSRWMPWQTRRAFVQFIIVHFLQSMQTEKGIHMESKQKKAKKPKIVTKPYLKGNVVDSHLLTSSLKFFGALALMAFVFLLLSTLLMVSNRVLCIILNLVVLAACYLLFYNSGAGKGTADVNLGEMLYMRKENGHTISAKDQGNCFHPLKGLTSAMIGTVPLFICAVLLAVTAHVQMTGLSTLPSWVSTYEIRSEIGDALAYYHTVTSMDLESVLRIIIRVCIMPMVSIVGTDHTQGLLLLERLSPIAALLPGIAYGLGYTRGPAIRAKVHTNIASNDRKRAKREKKQQQARAKRNEPEQLN